MATESCPVCEAEVPLDGAGTFVSCSVCGVPFVPREAARLALKVRDEIGPSPEGIELTPEFRGRYRLGRLLGVGAIGMVCEAVHIDSRRPVAVKFLKRIVDPALKERFLQEGRLLARVQHQNVLKIFELSDLDGFPYLITELMAGGTLKALINKEGRMPPAAAVALMSKCLDGLHACHEAGFIHRDLKPENILLTAAGEPAIADLGIARVLEAHAELTIPGSVMGTPRYMSPEQGRGEKVGIGTDIYAMGAVLYEMLAGQAPFTSPDLAELIRLQIGAPPPPLAEKVADLPEGLADVVHRALAKVPSERPLSAAAFKDALQRTIVRRSARTAARAPRQVRSVRTGGVASAAVPDPVPAVRPPGVGVLLLGASALAMVAAVFLTVRGGGGAPQPPMRSVDPAVEAAWRDLAQRIEALRPACDRSRDRVASLRQAIEENRFPNMVGELQQALAETDADVEHTRALLADVDAASARRADAHDLELARALARHWLALTRNKWLRQKKYMLAQAAKRTGTSDWEELLHAGPEMATAETLPILRRWMATLERLLRRPASMPSTAGPELAELMADVYFVSLATHHAEWHPAAQRQVDVDAKAFLASVGKLEGMTARLLERIISDLWRWGYADGSMLAVASGMMFSDSRDGTVEQLRSLSSFLAPPARAAIRDLMVHAQAGFKRRVR